MPHSASYTRAKSRLSATVNEIHRRLEKHGEKINAAKLAETVAKADIDTAEADITARTAFRGEILAKLDACTDSILAQDIKAEAEQANLGLEAAQGALANRQKALEAAQRAQADTLDLSDLEARRTQQEEALAYATQRLNAHIRRAKKHKWAWEKRTLIKTEPAPAAPIPMLTQEG